MVWCRPEGAAENPDAEIGQDWDEDPQSLSNQPGAGGTAEGNAPESGSFSPELFGEDEVRFQICSDLSLEC